MFQVNIIIKPSARSQPVKLANANADMPPTSGETIVTGYGSVVFLVFLFIVSMA